jgi:nicotinamidase/pyrazinamidase
MNRVHLLVIDPQNDFSDSKGNLFVAGADRDMKEPLPNLVKRVKGKLKGISVTLDSHHPVHIAHPIFWKDSAGNHPAPFTLISVADVKNGKWTPVRPSLTKRALEYVEALEKGGRYVLVIWPPHCLIGSWGHNVVPELHAELTAWENEFKMVNYVTKGSNPYTEHYSAIQADVPDPTDPGTQINSDLIRTLVNDADIVAIAGEASSHCVANTVRDIVKNFGDPKYAQKLVLLTDAMSAVGGFEKLADDFFNEMKALGVGMSTTTDFLK